MLASPRNQRAFLFCEETLGNSLFPKVAERTIGGSKVFARLPVKEVSMSRDEHEIERTRAFRPASVPIQDAVVSKERSGLVHTKAAAAKRVPHAVPPPLSKKSIPTSSMAERL